MSTINNKLTEGREHLAAFMAQQEARIIAEIGVEQGVYSEVICKANPLAMVYSIDAWKSHRGYRDHTRQSKLDRFYEISKERLAPYNNTIIRAFSEQAVAQFDNDLLDAVYIDANHNYENVTKDITMWSDKVKSGGIISGHDYIRRKGQDQYYAVVQALNDYCNSNGIEEITVWRGDEVPSWSFIKP